MHRVPALAHRQHPPAGKSRHRGWPFPPCWGSRPDGTGLRPLPKAQRLAARRGQICQPRLQLNRPAVPTLARATCGGTCTFHRPEITKSTKHFGRPWRKTCGTGQGPFSSQTRHQFALFRSFYEVKDPFKQSHGRLPSCLCCVFHLTRRCLTHPHKRHTRLGCQFPICAHLFLHGCVCCVLCGVSKCMSWVAHRVQLALCRLLAQNALWDDGRCVPGLHTPWTSADHSRLFCQKVCLKHAHTNTPFRGG